MFEMKRKALGYSYRDDTGDGGDSSGGFGNASGNDSSGGGWGANGYGLGSFGVNGTNTTSDSSPTGYGGVSDPSWGGFLSNLGNSLSTYGGNYGGDTSGYGGFGTNSADFGSYSNSGFGAGFSGGPTTTTGPTQGYGFNDNAFGTSQAVQSALGQLGTTQNQTSPTATGWGDLSGVSNPNGWADKAMANQAIKDTAEANVGYDTSGMKSFTSLLSKVAPYASFASPALGMGLSALGTGLDAANRASYGVSQNGQSIGAGVGQTLGSALGPMGSIAGKAIGTGVGGYASSGDSAASGQAAGKSMLGSIAGVLGSSIAGPVGGYAAGQLANSAMNNMGTGNVAATNGSSSQNPGGNTMLGQLANLYFANQAANSVGNAGNNLINSTDPNGQFRNNYAQQLNNLVTNPSSILSNPAYKMQYDLAMQNATRAAALGGGLGNGGAVAGIANAASTAASGAYQNQLSNLANLSNGNAVAYQAQLANQQAQINARNIQQQNYLKLLGQLGSDLGSWADSTS